MINFKGLLEYDKLSEEHQTLSEDYNKLFDDFIDLKTLCKEQERDYHQRVEELQKYYSGVTKEQKAQIDILHREIDKMVKKKIDQQKTIAELRCTIAKLEEKQKVRWGWIPSRGEWWPVEGTMEQIRKRVPVPLTYRLTDDRIMTEKEVATYGSTMQDNEDE